MLFLLLAVAALAAAAGRPEENDFEEPTSKMSKRMGQVFAAS